MLDWFSNPVSAFFSTKAHHVQLDTKTDLHIVRLVTPREDKI